MSAEIAQLGERKTEDLKVIGSIPVFGMRFVKRMSWALIFPLYFSINLHRRTPFTESIIIFSFNSLENKSGGSKAHW